MDGNRMLEWFRKWRVQILCVAGGILAWAAAGSLGKGTIGSSLDRSGYGEDPRMYEFAVDGPWEEPVECRVEIGPRQYTEEEAEYIFKQIFALLPGIMCGENSSLSEVRRDLSLPAYLDDYGVSVSWYSEDSEVIDSFGAVQTQEGETWLAAELSDGIHKRTGRFLVQVVPPVLSEQEAAAAAVAGMVRQADRDHPYAASVPLPEEYEGYPLAYRPKEEKTSAFLPLLGAVMAVLFYIREKNEVHKQQKERERRLLLGYADVVYQLMVFVGAGLTVGRAWERIVKNYESRLVQKRCGHLPALDEMAAAYGRMQCGISEGQAIAEFGKRCRLPPYLKLCSLLEQNRRTGTRDLKQILEQEMTAAWDQQKNLARRMGEEAGTKLLLPLLLMLLVVMVVILVPAMLSMR